MLPYALALGADPTFAHRFGPIRLPDCPCIRASRTQNLTPLQWSKLMRDIQRSMDYRRKHALMERLFRAIANFI